MKVNRPLSIFFRIYLRLKKKLDHDVDLTEQQKYAVDICRKLIYSDETSLMLAPISSTRFLKNDEKEISVVIHNRTITIVNKIYTYSTFIDNDKEYYNLINSFNRKMEKNTLQMESVIQTAVTNSLKSIMRQVSH